MKNFNIITTLILVVGMYTTNAQATKANKPAKPTECVGAKTYGTLADYKVVVKPNELKIMSYNVENLFDTQHDEGRDDYEFLPINDVEKEKCDFKTGYYKLACKATDWTDAKLELKLSQIKRIISVSGSLPDILTLNEVENVNVVSRLADYLGYEKFLVTSGSDKRIELALLYNENKVKLKEMKEVEIKFPEEVHIKATRNILVANFVSIQDPTKILGMFVNHWPSQSAPSGARVVAAKHLQKAIDANIAKYGDSYHAIAVGDFNTIDSDSPNPFEAVVLNPTWKNQLVDLHEYYISEAYKQDSKKMLSKLPPGTYFYGTKMSWNRLDRFFITKNLLDNVGVEVQAQNYRVIAPSFLLKTFYNTSKKSDHEGTCQYGTPIRYDHNASEVTEAGFSDHFPILTTVRL